MSTLPREAASPASALHGRKLDELAEWCKGKAHGSAMPTGVSTDSRTLVPGDLFVALTGPNFDGHNYLAEAFAHGASAALVDKPSTLGDHPGIVVPNTLQALGDLAHVQRWRPPLVPWVGVTGSNGKTTTRELIARILSTRGRVWSSPKNYNNLVGLPLTILTTPPDTRYGVLEHGTNRHGEIARLAWIAMPTVAVVTNVGASHLEGLGDTDGVAREKAAIYSHIPGDGLAVYPAADPRAHMLVERMRCPRAGFALEGGAPGADLVASEITLGTEGMSFRAGGVWFRTRLWGRHNIANVLAALLATRHLGIDFQDAAEALFDFHPVSDRLEPVRTRYLTILNDAYNANPGSMAAAVDVLREWPQTGRRVAVVGDMLELGVHSRRQHEEIGILLAEAGVDVILAAGKESLALAEAASTRTAHCQVRHFPGTKALVASLGNWLKENDLVLVKGSRGMHLEEAVAALKRWTPFNSRRFRV